MKQFDVYGIGHALLDMEFEVEPGLLQRMGVEKGTMTLVDHARQQELMSHLDAQRAKRSCGGSAANTIIGVAQFGGAAFHSCKVADDAEGAHYARELLANGVGNRLAERKGDDGATGRCLVMITPDAERTMCTCLGISDTISPDDVVEEALREAEYLYLEGYLVTSPKGLETVLGAARLARLHGVKVALTFSDPNIVHYFRAGLDAVLDVGVDLLFCNEREALTYAGVEEMGKALTRLQDRAGAWCVTLGNQGAIVHDGAQEHRIPGQEVTAVNTNGAGDLFAGAFLYGVTHGMGFEGAGQLACSAAAVLVTQFGARLQPGQAQEILRRHGG